MRVSVQIPHVIKLIKPIMSNNNELNEQGSVHTEDSNENNEAEEDEQYEEEEEEEEESVAGEVEDEGKQVVDDGLSNFKQLLEISEESGGSVQVEYNGVMVSPGEAKVLRHVVDNLHDHFGQPEVRGPPKIKFLKPELTNLGYDEKYKSKNDPPGDRWYSEINVIYTNPKINEKNDIVAMDGVYFDLNPKMTKDGVNAKNYGSTWINIYIPDKTATAFLLAFREGTGWSVSNHGFNRDEVQGITSITANMSIDDPPYFNVFHKKLDDEKKVVAASIKEMGPISVFMKNEKLRAIYKGTAFFSISMNVLTQVGCVATPVPSDNVKARIKFNLLDTRIFDKASNITSVRVGGKKSNGSVFRRKLR